MRDPNKIRARREVARRFHAFFVAMQKELADGAEEVWQRVERRLREDEGPRTTALPNDAARRQRA
jgi:hypothetical protein